MKHVVGSFVRPHRISARSLFNVMSMLMTLLFFGHGMVGVAMSNEANHDDENNRIVARQDYEVNSKLVPPMIMGRNFWNELGHYGTNSTQGKAMEKYVAKEPVVCEAMRSYGLKDLRAADTNQLIVDGSKLLALQPDAKVPFIIGNSDGRPPFRCLDDFQVEPGIYKKWKKAHPGFLGFYTGVEWDNEYVGPLNNIQGTLESYRKRGFSETVISRTQAILTNAVVDRDHALEGLHQCYNALRRYYFDDPDKMIFLRSWYFVDHYALEWGAGLVIVETTNTGPYRHQVSMLYTRGAARQYGKPWAWYIAMCYNGYEENGSNSVNITPYYTTNEKTVAPGDSDCTLGPGYGMSVSLNRRDMYLAYLSGASIVAHEVWPYAYCQYKDRNPKEWELSSPHGEAMKEWYAFTQRNADRGVSYAPVALLLPFNHGQMMTGGSPWVHFPVERPDTMIDAFMYTLVPAAWDLPKGKEGCLANSEYGDIYDVLVPNPPSGPMALDGLMNYKVAILLGGFNIDKALAERLIKYVKKGGTLVINSRQVNERLPTEFIGAKRTGKDCGAEGAIKDLVGNETVTLAEPYDYEQVELKGAKPFWVDGQGGILASVNNYGRGRVILTTVDYMVPRKSMSSGKAPEWYLEDLVKGKEMPFVKLLMRQVVKEALPVEVKGDVEFGLNKVSGGWWVYLINNKGVTKYTKTPEKLNMAETANVTVNIRGLAVAGVHELREDKDIAWDQAKNSFTTQVGPGDIRIIKITINP